MVVSFFEAILDASEFYLCQLGGGGVIGANCLAIPITLSSTRVIILEEHVSKFVTNHHFVISHHSMSIKKK